MTDKEKLTILMEHVDIMLANIEIIPDPKMGGLTDCYRVPIDDGDALKIALALCET